MPSDDLAVDVWVQACNRRLLNAIPQPTRPSRAAADCNALKPAHQVVYNDCLGVSLIRHAQELNVAHSYAAIMGNPSDVQPESRVLLPSSSPYSSSPQSGQFSPQTSCLSITIIDESSPSRGFKQKVETLMHRFESGLSTSQSAIFEHSRSRLCLLITAAVAVVVAVALTITLAVVVAHAHKNNNGGAHTSAGGTTDVAPPTNDGSSAGNQHVDVAVPPAADAAPGLNDDGALAPIRDTLKQDYKMRSRRLETASGVVASDHGRCSAVGAQILEAGGNAMDAAIATCICQGVLNPFASGVGGGFMLSVRAANGTSEFIDARETAPSAASASMFKDLPVTASILGGMAVGVPLELKGLELAWKRWGRLPWASLFAPAINLARYGFKAHPYLVTAMNKTLGLLQSNSAMARAFLLPTPEGGWRLPNVGEQCCVRPELANTLAGVAAEGASWLYSPARAASLAADIAVAGGVMTAEDLLTAQPAITPLTQVQMANYNVLLPPPPSAASTLATALNIMAGYATPSWSTPESWLPGGVPSDAQLMYQHYLVESMKHAAALDMRLGDTTPSTTQAPAKWLVFLNGAPIQNPPAVNTPQLLKDITSPIFADRLRALVNDSGILDVRQYGQPYNAIVPELVLDNLPVGTSGDMAGTHISVTDADHMAVSLTSTLNTRFGSMVLSPSTGLLLNSAMDSFSRPDISNTYDVYPAEANYIAPGKRPVSPLSPVIITEGDKLRMVVGASGGPHILSAVLQSIIRVLFLSWDPLDAVSVPRLHHQLLPYTVMYENYTMPGHEGSISMSISSALRDYLASKGNTMTSIDGQLGNVQMIYVKPDASGVVAACDPRKDGVPAAPDF